MTSQGKFYHLDSELLQTKFESMSTVRTKSKQDGKVCHSFGILNLIIYIIWNAIVPIGSQVG